MRLLSVKKCVCVHENIPHRLSCGPLDGHKHKDTLNNSLNVRGGGAWSQRGRASMCVQWGGEPLGGRGAERPLAARRERRSKRSFWPIVRGDNPKSGNQQQRRVVLSKHRGRRWSEDRSRASWLRRMPEKHHNCRT